MKYIQNSDYCLLTEDCNIIDPIYGSFSIPNGFKISGKSIDKKVWNTSKYSYNSPEIIKAVALHDWIYFSKEGSKNTADKLFKRLLRQSNIEFEELYSLYLGCLVFGDELYNKSYVKSDFLSIEITIKSKFKMGLCIGHSRFTSSTKRDGGALSADNTQEWKFNKEIAELMVPYLNKLGIEAIIYDDYGVRSYSKAMDYVATLLKLDKVDAAIELHFNSYNSKALGYEFLYWHKSTNGLKLASKLRDAFKESYPTLIARSGGLKSITSSDRGASFTRKPLCPSVICEPFFGDNPDEWKLFNSESGKSKLAKTYSLGIINYFS